MNSAILWLFLHLNPWGEIEVESYKTKEQCAERILDFKDNPKAQAQCVHNQQVFRKVTSEGDNSAERRINQMKGIK